MIEILKTVMGAVSTKDMVQVLTHFCIYKDLLQPETRIQGANGIVYIDAPFSKDITDCLVSATRFLKAVEACDDEPEFGITPGGKLSIKRGRFKAYLPMLPVQDFPRASLDGKQITIDPHFVDVLKRLKPFISEDASRPWSMALYMKNGYAYATNNIIVMRTPCAWGVEETCMPIQLVDRLLDIGEQPTACHVTPTSICFSFGDVWLRSSLINLPWPNVEAMYRELANEPVPDELKAAVEKIKDFCVNEKFPIIHLSEIVETDGGEQGASYEGFDLPNAAFHADQLLKVLSIATHVNFSAYPGPCAVRGQDLEGLIVGVKR